MSSQTHKKLAPGEAGWRPSPEPSSRHSPSIENKQRNRDLFTARQELKDCLKQNKTWDKDYKNIFGLFTQYQNNNTDLAYQIRDLNKERAGLYHEITTLQAKVNRLTQTKQLLNWRATLKSDGRGNKIKSRHKKKKKQTRKKKRSR